MAKAKKMPSGNWRVQVYSHTDAEGKRRYESFTAETKKEAELLAAEFAVNRKRSRESKITFGEAFDRYIQIKSNILSPSTLREMKRVRKHYFKLFEYVLLDNLSDTDIQREINNLSATLAPKTLHNLYGYITVIFATFSPSRKLHVTLPPKTKKEIIVPTDDEIKTLLKAAKGTSIYLPICLAAFGSLRRSEICALIMPDDLTQYGVRIRKSKVRGDNGYVIKNATKTPESTRNAILPQFVLDELKKIAGPVFPYDPNTIRKQFDRTLSKAGLRHIRFHDLRHYWVSSAMAAGMPDDYIMRNGGWATMTVPRAVYAHLMQDKNMDFSSALNKHFEEMQHEIQHD